jgi:hypothetical protein
MTSSRITPEQASHMSLAEQHDWFRRATSRRALLRGGLVGAGAVVAGPALLAGTAQAGTARSASRLAAPSLLKTADYPGGNYLAPFGRHVAYGADPTSQIAVAWQVAAPVTNPFLRVGPSPSDLGQPIPAEIRTLTTPTSIITYVDDVSFSPTPVTSIDQYYLHALVDGLRPGQTYYYSVGHSGWDFSGDVSALGSFTTARGGRAPFRFTAFGDEGVSYDAVATTTQVRTQNPAFHLHAGDVSYAEDGGDGLVTDPYDPRVWDSFFTEIDSAAAAIPWQVAVGNHEMEVWYSPDGYGGQYARFDFPGETTSSTPPTYYSFVYGNVGIVSLDANDVSYEIPANFGYSGGAQTAWLGSTLAALRANPNVDFIVAYFHHCAYSTCTTHGCEGGVETFWVPLFDQYSVDLVINGHNHVYERTNPLINGTQTENAPIGTTISPATQGTSYICAGGAGKSLYGFPTGVLNSFYGYVNNDYAIPTYINSSTSGGITTETVNWSQVRYPGYCLLVIDSVPSPVPGAGTSTLKISGLQEDGSLLDYIELTR